MSELKLCRNFSAVERAILDVILIAECETRQSLRNYSIVKCPTRRLPNRELIRIEALDSLHSNGFIAIVYKHSVLNVYLYTKLHTRIFPR